MEINRSTPPKTRPFPIKRRVLWVLFLYVFQVRVISLLFGFWLRKTNAHWNAGQSRNGDRDIHKESFGNLKWRYWTLYRLFWGWVLPRKFVVVFESFGSKSWLEKCLNSDFDSDRFRPEWKTTTLQQATNMTIENPQKKNHSKYKCLHSKSIFQRQMLVTKEPGTWNILAITSWWLLLKNTCWKHGFVNCSQFEQWKRN